MIKELLQMHNYFRVEYGNGSYGIPFGSKGSGRGDWDYGETDGSGNGQGLYGYCYYHDGMYAELKGGSGSSSIGLDVAGLEVICD